MAQTSDLSQIDQVTQLVDPAVNDSSLTDDKTSDEQTDEQHRISNEGDSVDENLVYPCMEKKQDVESVSGLGFSDDVAGQKSDDTIGEVTGCVNDAKTECQFTSSNSDECSDKQAIKKEVEDCREENLGVDSEELDCLKVENDCPALNIEGTDCCTSFVKQEQQLLDQKNKVSQNQPASVVEASNSVDEQEVKIPKPEKPRRRRLAPAPSLLIRDVGSWDIEEEIEKPKKGTKGNKRSDPMRTKGSTILLELLGRNLEH